MPENLPTKNAPDPIIKTAAREDRSATPADVLAEIRRIGLKTPPEAVSIVRAGRDYPAAPRVGVLAVARRGDRLLLVRRRNPPDAGKWGFPGGAQELGETVAEAAVRELREETGVAAAPVGVLDVVDFIDRDGEGRVRFHYTLVAVLAEWRHGEGVAADDVDEVRWIAFGELEALLATASERVGPIGRKALENL